MKSRITIDLDIGLSEMTQLQRTGFIVHKRGSKLQLEVGGRLLAHDKAVVHIVEEKDDDCTCKSIG